MVTESPEEFESGNAGSMATGDRWIGESVSRSATCETPTPRGASPRVHWRAGCLETVPVRLGGGRMEKDLQLVAH